MENVESGKASLTNKMYMTSSVTKIKALIGQFTIKKRKKSVGGWL